jgi:hypothetical protein
MEVPTLDDARHQRLLEWELTAPASRDPKTANALAALLGVSDRTLRDWRDKPEFQAAWKLGFQAVAGSMERTKALLDQLYADAMDEKNDKRTQSAKLYWDIARAISPPEPEVQSSRRAHELSDAELRSMLSESALSELLGRSPQPSAQVTA